MTERELKLLLDANALKQIQVHYAVMAQGYMIVANGNPLETAKRETREFKTLDTAARFLFKIGVADFAVKLKANAG
ncbi:MAG: plasmid replication protein RepB [Nitrosomonadales bacterium]|nr:plasmid replication protein RepB [Nitrosomonadales bacterium]